MCSSEKTHHTDSINQGSRKREGGREGENWKGGGELEGGQAGRRTKRLVVILEVNPAPNACDSAFPFLRIAGHNGAAVVVVLSDAHGEHLVGMGEGVGG